MHHRLLPFLLSMVLLMGLSCKTSSEAKPEQSIPEQASTVPDEGLSQGDSGASDSPISQVEEQETVEQTDPKPEPASVSVKRSDVKALPPRAGTKVKRESEQAEETISTGLTDQGESEDVLIDTAALESATESATEEEPLVSDAEAESRLPELTVLVEEMPDSEPGAEAVDELPSETEVIPVNPLLPIVIRGTDELQEDDREEPMVPDSVDIIDDETNGEEPRISLEEQEGMNDLSRGPVPEAAAETVPEDPAVSGGSAASMSSVIDESAYVLSRNVSGTLVLHLQGAGWVFLSASGEPELKLQDKSYEPSSGRTVFLFSSPGDRVLNAELVFMKQDLLRGESEQKTLVIDRTNSPAERLVPEEETQELSSDILSPLEDQERQDRQEDSVSETMKPLSSDAESELVTAEQKPVLPEDMSDYGVSRLYERALELERPGPDQSLEKALEIYIRIKRDFPVSDERFLAENRIRYLNKHYFKVQ